MVFTQFSEFFRSSGLMLVPVFDDVHQCEFGLIFLGQGNGDWGRRQRCEAEIGGIQYGSDLAARSVFGLRVWADSENRAGRAPQNFFRLRAQKNFFDSGSTACADDYQIDPEGFDGRSQGVPDASFTFQDFGCDVREVAADRVAKALNLPVVG